MSIDRSSESQRARRQAEEGLLGPPLPRGGALPPRLLANHPFVWLVVAHGVAQFGFWAFFLAMVAQASYAYHAGAFQLAVFFSSFSVVFLSLTAVLGMVTDRWSPKWMLILGQAVVIVAVVVCMVGGSMTALYLGSVVDGLAAAAIIPARGSLTALLMSGEDLVRANGMLNAASTLAVIAGPLATGVLARRVGAEASYVAVLIAVMLAMAPLALVPDRRPRDGERGSFLGDLRSGFRFSLRHSELRALLVLGSAGWFILTVLITLEPVFVREVLGRRQDGLGLLWAAHGAGGFVGAIAMSRMHRASGREVALLGLALVVGGVGLAIYVGTAVFALAAVGNAIFGATFAWFLSLSQALIQRVAAEDMRGRVTGIVGMLEETSALVCSLTITALAGVIATVQPYLIASAVLLSMAGIYGMRAGSERRLASLRLDGAGEQVALAGSDGAAADAAS